jgi:Zn-dependent peptidase ImmA (M78 family)
MNLTIEQLAEQRKANYRKQEIAELAESIAKSYLKYNILEPEQIAVDEGITYSRNDYGKSFDGLLEHHSGRFHIYINECRVGSKEVPRARHTFAHELGHYFIDEHRNSLKSGKTPSHPSFNGLKAKNIVEREADYFASCLLMPSVNFTRFCLRQPLDNLLLEKLAKTFNASISSVIFRYFELNLFPMLIVLSKNGIIEWKMVSEDFRYKYLPKKQGEVPPTSVAGEYFSLGKKPATQQIVFAYDWCKDFNVGIKEQLWEKCYYLSETKVMSVIWRKEK